MPNVYKYLALIIIVITLLFAGYSKGVTTTTAKYEEILTTMRINQEVKIARIETSLDIMSKEQSNYTSSLRNSFKEITKGLNNKPLVIYKDGECTLSKEFLDSRQKAIDKVNQK
jgi:hypothetical protein